MKTLSLYLSLFVFTFYTCKNNGNQAYTINEINVKSSEEIFINDSINTTLLDSLLICDRYAYFEADIFPHQSYYRIPYNGCLYNPTNNYTNRLGWADVILIPKRSSEFDLSNIDDYDKIDSLVAIINRMHPIELKKKFIPIIFLIEKKYLHYMENVEINYYPKLPYVKKMFEYSNRLEKWIMTDSINITNEIDDNKWVDMKIQERIN